MTSPTLDELRYPIGKVRWPSSDTPESRAEAQAEALAALRAFPSELKAALAGLDDAQLDTSYRDGGWTVRQTVHHLADSHINAYIRVKLALTEDWPTIKPYDECAWAELADNHMPVAISIALLESLHQRLATLLASLSDIQLQHGYVHPAGGRHTVSRVFTLYAWHGRHHIAHITALRRRMGW